MRRQIPEELGATWTAIPGAKCGHDAVRNFTGEMKQDLRIKDDFCVHYGQRVSLLCIASLLRVSKGLQPGIIQWHMVGILPASVHPDKTCQNIILTGLCGIPKLSIFVYEVDPR